MVKLKKYYFLICLFILVSSCDSDNTYLSNNCIDLKHKSSFDLKQELFEISVQDTLPTEYQKIQIVEDKYLIGRFKNQYNLDIYSLQNKQFIKRINIDKNLVPNFASFYVHSLDSIFITQDPNSITLINNEGVIINKWKLDNAPINWKVSEDTNVPLYYFDNDRENINFFDKISGNLHLTLTNTDIYYFSNRENFKLHHVFNINQRKWLNSYGKIDSAYSNFSRMSKQYLPFQSHPFCYVKGDSSYIGYPMSHLVFIFNNKNGKLIDSKCVSSNFIEKILPPIAYDADHQTEMGFLITSPYYGSIHFHKKLGLFSRIAIHQQNETLPDGKLNKISNKTVSAILFDKNLNKVDELLLDKNSHFSTFGDPNSMFISYPMSDGFIGTKKDKFVDSESTFRHSIYFKITKK